MNFIDILILIVLALAVWKGYKKGFIIELFTVLAVFAGLYAGIHFSDSISRWFHSAGWKGKYIPTISFFICFLAVGAMLYFGGKALEKVIRIVQLSLINRLLGVILSLITGMLLIGAVILLTTSIDDRSDIVSEKTKKGSLLYYPTLHFTEMLLPVAKKSSLYVKNTMHKKPNEIIR